MKDKKGAEDKTLAAPLLSFVNSLSFWCHAFRTSESQNSPPKHSVGKSTKMSNRLPNEGLTEQSVFKIIFVKLANFRANILEAEGDFL